MTEALQSAAVKIGNLWDVIVNLIGSLCGWALILSVVPWPDVACGFYPRLSAATSSLWMPDGFMGAVDALETYMYAHSRLFLSVGVILLIGIVLVIRDVDDTEKPRMVFYTTKHLYYENCAPCLLIAVTLSIASGRPWFAAAEVIILLLLLAVLRTGIQQCESVAEFMILAPALPKVFFSELGAAILDALIGIIVTLLFPVDLLWRLFVYATPPSQVKQAELKKKYEGMEKSHPAPDGARRRHDRP